MPSTLNSSVAAQLAVRLALAASFLSAVADRFGGWGPVGSGEVTWGTFATFTEYTAVLLWYLPPSLVLILAWIATILEVLLAVTLLCGLWLRWSALISGLLLLTFAVAMTSATGVEGPLSYSVWTAAAAAFLLASVVSAEFSTG